MSIASVICSRAFENETFFREILLPYGNKSIRYRLAIREQNQLLAQWRRDVTFVDGLIRNTEFFTTAELAEKLKMNVQVITRKVQAGEIRAYKIGKEWRIPEQSVHAWLEEQANRPVGARNETTGPDRPASRLAILRTKAEPTSHHRPQLEYILAQLEPQRWYSEDELARLIGRFHTDIDSIRRDLLSAAMIEPGPNGVRRSTTYTIS